MRIINNNNNIILADTVVIADTIFTRVKGLLGRRNFSPGAALVIRPCNSIHTFFMKFPIDVIFVDYQDRVVKIILHMPPYRISSIYFNAYYAVEFPAKTLQKDSVNIGDQIKII